MPTSMEYNYTAVDGEEEKLWLHDTGGELSENRIFSAKGSRVFWILSVIVVISSVLCGGAIGYNLRGDSTRISNAFEDTSQLNIYDGIDFKLHMQRFNGSFFRRSPYSGPPTPEIDATWGRFTEAGSSMLVKINQEWMPDYPPVLNVSIEDAQKSTGYSLETAVHLNDTQNIGYMASVGIFHQVHCLNMLRKFIYLDYYEGIDPHWAQQPLLRQHADHCVDMLREVLMCHGDTSLIVYHWIKDYVDPTPDFSTVHSCRDPEDILQWMKSNQVQLSETVLKHGEIDLPEIF